MENNSKKIKLIIVDDEALIVTLLTDFFSSHEKIKVIGSAYNGLQLIEILKKGEQLPDIVMLDLQMKEMNGIDTTSLLKQEYPEIKIIVVSSHYKKNFMGYMMKLGVNAFLPKGVLPSLLATAICEVHSKGYYFLDEQIEVMRSQISSNAPAPNLTSEEALSDREIEVLQLICQQYTAQQIADKLFITKRTVEGHKSNLLLKTAAKNTAGLVIYAIQKKLVDIDQCFWTE